MRALWNPKRQEDENRDKIKKEQSQDRRNIRSAAPQQQGEENVSESHRLVKCC